MQLSVIIVNYNVKYFLEQALLAAQKACAGLEADIWVVDNNSSDGSVEMLRERFPGVKLITNTENTGFSKANNQAIKASTGKYVLLLNPDTVVAEDTFQKVIAFMEQRPQAGGLGIRMLDGSGNFLKESKRGLPTPEVAFYKMFGLSSLFKKSQRFGQYHLSFLPEKQNHPVDILAGAFMCMRRDVLDEIGLLDEKYFMYGEDIDLSYRIRLAGYENWYFANSSIIHYKGESTKKDSIKYVRVFYQAMAIFSRQYFSPSSARLFGWLIQGGILFRAFIALLRRWSKRTFHPLLDAVLLYLGMLLLVSFWEKNVKVEEGTVYPDVFVQLILPVYVLLWIAGAYFSGAYDKPFRASRLVRGLLAGTLGIAAIYGFFPPDWRYSRGLIVVGAAWSIFLTVAVRTLLHLAIDGRTGLSAPPQKRVLVVGSSTETDRVHALLMRAGVSHKFLGFVSDVPSDDQHEFFAGRRHDLQVIVKNLRADELIFCGADISNKEIIHYFESMGHQVSELKIVPAGSDFIIGSSSVDYPGDTYTPDFNLRINLPASKRNKRLVDVGFGLVFLVGWPLLFWLYPTALRHPLRLIQLIMGKYTLIGYPKQTSLPQLKPALLQVGEHLTQNALQLRMRKAYAKDYSAQMDLHFLWESFKNSR